MTLRHAVAKGSTGTKNRLVFMAFPRSWPRVTVIHAHSSPIQKRAPDFDAPPPPVCFASSNKHSVKTFVSPKKAASSSRSALSLAQEVQRIHPSARSATAPECPRRQCAQSVPLGHRSSIFSRMRLAFSTASAMAHSRAGHGLTPISLSLRAARIVAAKRIAYFRCSSIPVLQRKRGCQIPLGVGYTTLFGAGSLAGELSLSWRFGHQRLQSRD